MRVFLVLQTYSILDGYLYKAYCEADPSTVDTTCFLCPSRALDIYLSRCRAFVALVPEIYTPGLEKLAPALLIILPTATEK